MIHVAAERLGVSAASCVMVGDTIADLGAARAAGAGALLVPTDATLAEEIDIARSVGALASTLGEAVERILRYR